MVARDPQDREPPFRPYLTVGRVLAALVLVVAGGELVRNLAHPTIRDFIAFWAAARITLSGTPALAYDGQALHALQSAVVTFRDSTMPYPYPPATLILVAPLGLLTYPAAMLLWSVVTLLLFVYAVRRLYPGTGWLAVSAPAVFVNLALGQNGLILTALGLCGLKVLPTRPFHAGLILGCLIVKPQLALMLPVAVLAGQQWKAITGAILSASAVLLVGIALFGWQATHSWYELMTAYPAYARNGNVGWEKVASIYGALRELGASSGIAFAVHAAVASLAAAAVWQVWRSDAPAGTKIAIVSAASLLASPYFYIYDTLLAVPACFWLVERRVAPAWIAVLWLLPLGALINATEGVGVVNLYPVAPMILLALVYRQWLRDRPSSDVAPKLEANARPRRLVGF